MVAHAEPPKKCGADGILTEQGKIIGGGGVQPDLVIDKPCQVLGTKPYYFGNVNIIKGGKLIFIEPPVEPTTEKTQDFWATAIIIENGGEMYAGVDYPGQLAATKAYGTNGKTLRFHLYGKDPGRGKLGALCVQPTTDEERKTETDCGIPRDIWVTNGEGEVKLPGDVTDHFYKYSSLHGDADCPDAAPKCSDDQRNENIGHFGNKVLAVSYGGTLQLRGMKGTTQTSAADIATLQKNAGGTNSLTDADEKVITNSGSDWIRLAGIDRAAKTLTLDRSVTRDWTNGDQILLTTTDFFPDHSESLTIARISDDGKTVTVQEAIKYDHNAKAYPVGDKIGTSAFRTAVEQADANDPGSTFLKTAETRAVVGLLTRSIRVLSAGDEIPDKPDPDGNDFPAASTGYQYGGQTVYRQGFQKLQVQGVEFAQLGQGGVLGRYAVHFHEARQVPKGTYVIDSSVNESMTRWFVIHSTLDVTLARNVGYKSIGHGFYLEDATETDNRLYANLGVFARAGVEDLVKGQGPNPRKIPGILSSYANLNTLPLKYHSDAQYPSVFWITNGWNSIAGNMAAGAGTCGACYWIPALANHDMKDVQPAGEMEPMEWKGYSAIQVQKGTDGIDRAGLSPVRFFYKNACTSAMHSLNNSDGSVCKTVSDPNNTPVIQTIRNPLAPAAPSGDYEPVDSKMYYPRYTGIRHPTFCDPSKGLNEPGGCTNVDVKCENDKPKDCAVTAISHYTTSFNWAQGTNAAVWLRFGWQMFDHGFISDVQGAGITEVSGGDYTRPNLPIGYWALVSNSIFVGATQPGVGAASATRPAGCKAADPPFDKFCLDEGGSTAFPLADTDMMLSQRLYSIYDGPSYQDANAYLDIKTPPCLSRETCIAFNAPGVRRAVSDYPPLKKNDGYLPNAAIGWKQPNGFYYPPAFHSRNLFFNNVDIRHYIVEPLFKPGTYDTDTDAYQKDYVGQIGNTGLFATWTDVDRQTELNDDDGSLTGFADTLSLNEDPYFRAPVQAAECRSNLNVDPKYACAPQQTGDNRISVPTARTSPYDHITTVIYPGCAVQVDKGKAGDACNEILDSRKDWSWGRDCTNPRCYGVPIYRQFLTSGGPGNPREWETWGGKKCPALGDALRKMNPDSNEYKVKLAAFGEICRFPFIRMAGVDGWQRSVLTANNGNYYIDTTVSGSTQVNAGAQNIFAKGQTYYVFFLFAKNDGKTRVSKQTYQIYVGPGFDKSTVKGWKIKPVGWPIKPTDMQPWENFPWTPSTVKDDVLKVEVDFSKVPQSDIDPAFKSGSVLDETCKPVNFCKRDGSNSCVCEESKIGPLISVNPAFKKVCATTCSDWAVKDLDCPKDGCRGFSFTLPDGPNGFAAKDQYRRPNPEVFPTAPPSPWATILFKPTTTLPDKSVGADCNYDGHVPGQGKCKAVE
jgi:hypothetical protein